MRKPKRLRNERAAVRPAIEDRGGTAVIRLGAANIWDNGDLTRIREAASRIFEHGATRIGIDLAHVGVLPGGFLHMLCCWQDRGVDVYLFEPRPNVQQMLWFRTFAEACGERLWRMSGVSGEKPRRGGTYGAACAAPAGTAASEPDAESPAAGNSRTRNGSSSG